MIPLLALKPSGSRDRAGIVVPTAGGALRVVGDTWLVEEGTTNYIIDPIGVLLNWSASLSSMQTVATAGNGNAATAIRMTATGSGTSNIFNSGRDALPPTGGLVHCLSVDVKGYGSTIAKQFRTQVNETGGAIGAGATYLQEFAVTASWLRHSISGATSKSDRTGMYAILSLLSATTGDYVDITAIQHETKDHPTTFCPAYDSSGILLPGYTWSGTPHASSSSRAAASLAAPLPSSWQSVYIRYHEGDGTPLNTVLDDEGAIGTYGLLTVASDTATITSNRALYMSAALFYDRALTTQEIARLDATPTALLGWGTLQQRQSGVLRIGDGIALPGVLRVGG